MNEEELSKEQIVEEIVKCRKDPVYYITTYCKISHPMKGFIPFTLYDFQKEFVQDIKENRYVIVLKSRQLGISTVVAAYALWLASFHTAKKIVVIANKGEVATNFINNVKDILNNLPDFITPKAKIKNRQSLEFTNGSKIKATATTKSAGRSEAVSLLVLDEAAEIMHAEEIWTAASPTLATGGSAIVIATPKGVGNWFHKTYIDAEAGVNKFKPVKFPWNLHPDRDKAWYDSEIKQLGTVKFAQEHGCDFLKSGNTVIPIEELEWYKTEKHIIEPFQKTNFDNNLWIWKYPDYGKNYIVCADVARGDSADYSTAQVICTEDMEQVAEYKGKIPTDIFGHLLVELGVKYKNALLIIENGTIGWATIQKVQELNYPNLYWSSKNVAYIDPIHWGTPDRDKVPGFTTGPRSRPLVINKIQEAIRTHSLIFHSERLFEEFKTFVYDEKTDEARAQRGYNDDLIMAIGIGVFVRATSLKIIENTQMAYKSMPVLFSNSRTEFNTNPALQINKNNPYVQDGENISWVL